MTQTDAFSILMVSQGIDCCLLMEEGKQSIFAVLRMT